MIFNTFIYYFIFLFPAAILFRLCSPSWRAWTCVIFGMLFFIYFSFTLEAGGWGALCVLIFLWEAMLRRYYKEKGLVCLFGILVSLLVLGIFKYWNFTTGLIFSFSDRNPLHWSHAFLPLGVSFFTFEFIHYAYDRYKGRVEQGSAAEYLAFIFFFPTMVAGPIKRFQDFLPCLRNPNKDWALDWNRGLTRILTGLVKKFAIADFLTSLTDNLNADDIAAAPRGVLLVWIFAYGWKIYFDFSAYSDIAIGSGRLFGIKIPENFDWPYSRTSITDFWRHWHMSLYKWLVDYVFIPLGGSRVSPVMIYRNVILVMLVSGIWHGAGMNFVLWGLWHGILLAGHRMWTQTFCRAEGYKPNAARLFVSWILTYVSVNLGWALFAMDVETAALFFQRLLMG